MILLPSEHPLAPLLTDPARRRQLAGLVLLAALLFSSARACTAVRAAPVAVTPPVQSAPRVRDSLAARLRAGVAPGKAIAPDTLARLEAVLATYDARIRAVEIAERAARIGVARRQDAHPAGRETRRATRRRSLEAADPGNGAAAP